MLHKRSDGSADDRLAIIRRLAERVAASYGLEIFDLQLRREAGGWVLRVFLDRPAPASPAPEGAAEAPVGIEDCRRVSLDLSALLDVEDPLDYHYTLEVSSPGLDRPLRHADDYRRFTGRLARLVVAEPVAGQKFLVGRLKGLEAGRVLLEGPKGQVLEIPLALITRARLEVEF